MGIRATLLAAGRSFRMAPLKDKNSLPFFGKPFIAHQLEMIIASGLKDILIICGKHNLESFGEIRRHMKRKNVDIEIVEQKKLELGMAGALLTAKKVWKKDQAMLLISPNDVVDQSVFEKAVRWSEKGSKSLEGILSAKKVTSYFPGGYLVTDRKGLLKKIVEKPGRGKEPSDLVNLVIHLHFRPDVLFKYVEEVSSKRDDRYEAALQNWILDGGRFRADAYRGFWQPVKYPWHVLSLMRHHFEKMQSRKAVIARTAKISGKVYLARGVKVMDYAVIQGPCYIGEDSVIGTGSLVRQSHIGRRCVVGYGSEIARSYVGDDCWFHANYIGDSVIGNNVAFGSGAVTGNLRLDEETVKVNISKTWNGKAAFEKKDTGLTKFGAVIGDDVRIGVNTSLMPGVKIGSGSFVGAGLVIAEDIPNDSFVRGEWKIKVSKNAKKIVKRNGRTKAVL